MLLGWSCSRMSMPPTSMAGSALRRALVASAGRDGLPRLELDWGDGARAGSCARWLADARGWRVEVPKHRDRHLWRYGPEETPEGFQVIPRRLSAPLTPLRGIGRSPMAVERTFAWLSRSRPLARDHERRPETGVAMIHTAMSRIMLRRVARSWTDPVPAPTLPTVSQQHPAQPRASSIYEEKL
jgi:transposase